MLVAIGVGLDGHRAILGVAEGAKEDKSGWGGFLKHLKERGLTGVKLIIKEMKLPKAALLIERAVPDTLAYYAFPDTHWRSLRTNNPMERLMREIRRRTRVVGAFPDGQSALMLVAARLRHIATTHWGTRRYLAMEALTQPLTEEVTAA